MELQSSPAAQRLPGEWTPAPRRQPKSPADTRSVFANRDRLYIDMTEAMLRLTSQYPGLVDKVAHTIALQPGQSREISLRSGCALRNPKQRPSANAAEAASIASPKRIIRAFS